MDEIEVIKLGGSIISDRAKFQVSNPVYIEELSKCIANYVNSGSKKIVLILGGGAYAHEILYLAKREKGKYLHSCKQNMIESLKLIRCEFQQSLKRYDVESMSYDINDFVEYQDSQVVCNTENLLSIMTSDALTVPILTGGIIHADSNEIITVSSDDIPKIIASKYKIDYFISLTDVEGVMLDADTVDIYKTATLESEDMVLRSCQANKFRDMTGGMKKKVEGCFALLRVGVPSYIGGIASSSEKFVFETITSGGRRGTYFKNPIKN